MLATAFIFGLLGSFHCIGMCGPIAFMLPLNRNNKVKQFFQISSYHLGRLFTYGLIGLLFGFLGKGFYLFGFQQIISIVVGLLMILAILLPKVFRQFKSFNFIQRKLMKIKSKLGKELVKKENDTFFTIGFLNGFLPCGLVYMALFGALATGNAFKGSLYMFLFGLGTVPLMTVVAYFGNFSNVYWRQKIQRVIPFVVVFIGILFVLRGLGLGIPFVSPLKPLLTETFFNVSGCH